MDDLITFLRGRLNDTKRELLPRLASPRRNGKTEVRRMLADVEAKLRIIDHCVETIASLDPDDPADRASITDLTVPLRLLALPYAYHPDYRQEWRP